MNLITLISVLSGIVTVIGGISGWFKLLRGLQPKNKAIWTISIIILGLVLIAGGIYHYNDAANTAINYEHDLLSFNNDDSIKYVCPQDQYAAQQEAARVTRINTSMHGDFLPSQAEVKISGTVAYMSDSYALVNVTGTQRLFVQEGVFLPDPVNRQVTVLPNGFGWCIPFH